MLLRSLLAPLILLPAAFTSSLPTTSTRNVQYYALDIPTSSILSAVSNTFNAQSSSVSTFYHKLQSTNRIQKSFHVTLIHTSEKRQFPDVWKYYSSGQADGAIATVELKNIVWDDRIMAIQVSVAAKDGGSLPTGEGKETHITIGTANNGIKSVESNDLIERWRNGEARIQSVEVTGSITNVPGTVKGF